VGLLLALVLLPFKIRIFGSKVRGVSLLYALSKRSNCWLASPKEQKDSEEHFKSSPEELLSLLLPTLSLRELFENLEKPFLSFILFARLSWQEETTT